MRSFIPIICLFLSGPAGATTLHVGAGHPYATLSAAVAVVAPGDTIFIHAGSYPGGLYFANLQGTSGQWITISNAPGETVVFEGGGNAIQLTDPAYLRLYGLIFQHQTGNGVNVDDGGSYASPAHHVVFEDCVFRDMSASGNNDLLKLSGLDYFEVRNCTFQNGAAGGSGIDMVGCHHGLIEDNFFENLGSNSIQCKGGSEWVRIEGNFFRDGGQRTLNLGGSTGLQFFRPDTAHFEAANLQVYANIIVGSWAPVAYVGAVNVEVANNTIYQPENWVVRILQETVDPDRFLECGDNSFINNIVWLGDDLNTEVNIGPNTAPETFVFSNNLWFNASDANWPGPNLPVAETNTILNDDPLFNDPANDDFSIPPGSPAAGAGTPVPLLDFDYLGQAFATPPSIGAIEANPVSGEKEPEAMLPVRVFPNPATGAVRLEWYTIPAAPVHVQVFNTAGQVVRSQEFDTRTGSAELDLSMLAGGLYVLRAVAAEQWWQMSLVKL
ncbi:MAG: T9SS C-terminal target domain-containing protein [Haliscomenobacteraceae bacterium CHB4]|nr:hypothetical protein [Saprospiraceae bacterium]MCE7923671.1 T9SS C-terminal target domain-containing protein [Haliscomenobacteraceae bacterium CHB4]